MPRETAEATYRAGHEDHHTEYSARSDGRGALVNDTGRLVFISGQVPEDNDGQRRLAWRNPLSVLETTEMTMRNQTDNRAGHRRHQGRSGGPWMSLTCASTSMGTGAACGSCA
jgi:hypothetical protein